MKSYLLILIRIGMINFLCILLVMVYISRRPVVANSTKKPIVANGPGATRVVTLPETTPSPSATDVPYVIETATPTASPSPTPTRTPVPTTSASATARASSTSAATASPTPQPTQQPTAQPTQAPTASPTPQPTAPPNPLLVKVAPHNTETDCWMVIDSHIYNVSDYMKLHPGGKDPLVIYCGKDGTTGYHTKDKNPPVDHTPTSNSMLELFLVE